MKRKAFIPITALVLAIASVFAINCVFADNINDNKTYDFYCVGNKEHKTPPLDSRFSFMSEYDAYYADTTATEDDKVIYLTFDAGYENGNIEKVLNTLKKHNAKGAFFILDNLIKRNPELVLRMGDEGHLVCNHTRNHPDMSKITDKDTFAKQLSDLDDTYFEMTGKHLEKIYRPPMGKFSVKNLKLAKELGYKTVFWSFAYADWDNNSQPSPEKALDKVLSHIHNGEIMLLHPTSATNALILDKLISNLEEQGYRFGLLSEIWEKGGVCTNENKQSVSADNQVKKRIALTFDDGPSVKYDEKILSILDKYNIKATFFMIGENVYYHPEYAKAIADKGHEIGNHTYTHKKIKSLKSAMLEDEIYKTEKVIKEVCGKTTTLFRPPEGYVSDTVTSAAKKSGYSLVLWTIDTRDWCGTSADKIVNTVMKGAKDGSIILCHDYVYKDSHTAQALESFIPKLIEDGYEFVTVSEIIAS